VKHFIYIISILLISNYSQAQSCCSGGVPLSGNLGLPTIDKGKIQLVLSYDLNVLNTLKDGTEKLDDRTRKRTTHTFLLQSNYGITDHFAFEVLVPFVIQQRELNPIGLPSSFDQSAGIGDILFLAKYKLLKYSQIGIGLKMPVGSTTELNSQGLIFNADMQY